MPVRRAAKAAPAARRQPARLEKAASQARGEAPAPVRPAPVVQTRVRRAAVAALPASPKADNLRAAPRAAPVKRRRAQRERQLPGQALKAARPELPGRAGPLERRSRRAPLARKPAIRSHAVC